MSQILRELATINVFLEYLAVLPTGLTTADHVYGVVWASGLPDVKVVNRVPHGGGEFMVWAGISDRQRTR
jgi:hypothetical protein